MQERLDNKHYLSMTARDGVAPDLLDMFHEELMKKQPYRWN
jgi:hypothetical protein